MDCLNLIVSGTSTVVGMLTEGAVGKACALLGQRSSIHPFPSPPHSSSLPLATLTTFSAFLR